MLYLIENLNLPHLVHYHKIGITDILTVPSVDLLLIIWNFKHQPEIDLFKTILMKLDQRLNPEFRSITNKTQSKFNKSRSVLSVTSVSPVSSVSSTYHPKHLYSIIYLCNVNNPLNSKLSETLSLNHLSIHQITIGELITNMYSVVRNDIIVDLVHKKLNHQILDDRCETVKFTEYNTLINKLKLLDFKQIRYQELPNDLIDLTITNTDLKIMIHNMSVLYNKTEEDLTLNMNLSFSDPKYNWLYHKIDSTFYMLLRTSKLVNQKLLLKFNNLPIQIIKKLFHEFIMDIYQQKDKQLLNDNTNSLQTINSSIQRLNENSNSIPYPLKQLIHLNTYFDQIYIMTIDRLKNRYDRTVKLLNKNGIYNFQKFINYDAKEENRCNSSLYQEYLKYLKQPLSRDELAFKQKGIKTLGSWCILKGYKNLLEQAKRQNYQKILILQDDLLFHQDFIERFDQYIKMLPNNWKLLYLGASQHVWPPGFKSTSWYYHPAGTADGAFATAISSRVYDELIHEINKGVLPVDTGALRTIQKKYVNDCYVIYPNLIIADIRISDLRGQRMFENTGQLFKWEITNYDVPEMDKTIK